MGALAITPSNLKSFCGVAGKACRRPIFPLETVYTNHRWWSLVAAILVSGTGQQIAAILVDPRDPNRVLVAVLGLLTVRITNEEFSLTDGGLTCRDFVQRRKYSAIDLAFDPSNPQIVYADMWASRRPPWTAGGGYNGPGSGLYNLPTVAQPGREWQGIADVDSRLGRIGLGIAPTIHPDLRAGWILKLGGLYRSDMQVKVGSE